MSGRLIWLVGPVSASALLFGASRVFARRFEAGLPVARGIPPEFVVWLALGVTLLVVVIWLVSTWESRENEE
jgi:hypothetical protein